MEAAREKEQFLADCAPEERDAFSQMFLDTEDLARLLGDPNPDAESALGSPLNSPLRLRWAFESRKGASLRLQHPKLTRGPATILWAFPSRNHDRTSAMNGLSIQPGAMTAHTILEEDAQQYGRNLAKADFEDIGKVTWQTTTAGLSDGFSRIYRYPVNRYALRDAIAQLVKAIDLY